MDWLITALEVALGGLLVLHLVVRQLSHKKNAPFSEELFYYDPRHKSHHNFPQLKETAAPSVHLSIVFPCYNEEQRLTSTMHDTITYVKQRADKDAAFTYEIIVVDDGSRDKTADVAMSFVEKEGCEHVRLLKLVKNRGKGGAVTEGMMRSRGKYILFADGDNATSIADVEKLEKRAKEIERNGLAIAIGSRAHLVGTDAVVRRSFIRNLLMRVFHMVVYVLGVKNIQDTQCGFKLFSRKAAQLIMPSMRTEGWIFDIEIFILAELLKIPVVEVGVTWHEIAGSKLSLATDSIRMLKDLFIIRYNYTLGIWHPTVALSDLEKIK